jgi:hypothetical protein
MLTEKHGGIMLVKITIRSTVINAEFSTEGECQKEGDVKNGIEAALNNFRSQHPSNPPFEWKLSVEKA